MACSNCGIPGQNARGCHKMDKQCDKGKKQTNERHMTLIDEEDVEYPTPTQDCGGLSLDSSPIDATMEDFPLTVPQPTQYCASDEDEYFGLDVEDDMPWKSRDFSELKSRIQQKQKQAHQEESTLIVMVDYTRRLCTKRAYMEEKCI
ncbi:hypothetical protein MTR67_036049 [Solanum verrucosum]|uniref:Uncharacterized protein n=1 Tax=Solanum verrucosum TaxID=315347 RepID=A0AAF0ZMV7_SOLVR|nr:hypothetical protein MTR67_036049 [Solanum verrucosum]